MRDNLNGKCRRCHKTFELYGTWNGRSHLCLSCRKESYQKKNRMIHDTNMNGLDIHSMDINEEGLELC